MAFVKHVYDLDDVDEMVVERIVMRDRPWGITMTERVVSVARLTKMGFSARLIGEILWCTARQVCRDRAQARRLGLL